MSLLALALVAALAPQDSAVPRGNRLVKLELIADRAAVAPGETFTLGVKFAVEKGWHIYWDNPGDSGLPTKIQLRGPEGFTIGAPRSPTPEREVAEGDIVTFVHKGDVLFLADVRAPKEIPKDMTKIAFDVDASWLVCIESCFPGSGKAHLELPLAGANASKPAPANEKVFEAARARLPRPWSELESEIEWSGSGEHRTLRFSVPRASSLEIFPLTSETTSLVGRTTAKDDRACRLVADLAYRDTTPPGAPRLKGLLVVKTAQGESAYEFDTAPIPDRK
ncbi:MAG TPA: protein-disulfide reductase DsbD domain-containing protein [Planctomycetota bacterium]|jgi:thiol:disulfide interchange protein DsbD|nr:protein-disulfide reductase DsbD domain-containing protein [Planctomycetota bacterium]